ncbi:MAG: hypothetical protein CUN55_00750 [Phototrophicales bacterium]|nr:MAG: hypothetical protein CUN55_00750 [Phototrophicales bacterium]
MMSSEEYTLNLSYLQVQLRRLDLILSVAVQYARNAGFDPNNEFQGLFISEEEVGQHLRAFPGVGFWGNTEPVAQNPVIQPTLQNINAQLRQIETEAETQGFVLRLRTLQKMLGLTVEDLDLLIVALAPAIDRRYERIYGFLQDDVTKRRPTVNLAINLLGKDWADRLRLWQRLTDQSPLVEQGLLELVADPAMPHSAFHSYMLKVDSHIADYVQLVDSIPKAWQFFLKNEIITGPHWDELILEENLYQTLSRHYGHLSPIFHFYGNYGSGRHTLSRALAFQYGLRLVETNLKALVQENKLNLVRLAFREGRLYGALLLLHEWDSVLDEEHDIPSWLWAQILDYPYPVVLSGKEEWVPRGINRTRPIIRIELPIPEFTKRLAHWQAYLADTEVQPAELAYKFKLTPGQIRDAVYSAYDDAIGQGKATPDIQDVYRASRAQSSRRLSSLAVKIKPRYTWHHIVLPEARIQQLREICDQVKYAVRVYDEWGFKGRSGTAQGLTALFAGQSGTGKTMAAEIIANELGLELFKIDLSAVVSKYIGETEKNLATIFDEAAQSNAILFFDEADALFGKRSEVKDSHDRYANIETGYLLQRMETYDGVAILASNLRQNLDEAFTRRLDFMIDFPFPETEDRLRIWQVSFPPNAPLDREVNLEEIAERYRMAGGNIRNAAMAAAFLAVADDSPTICMRHVIHAIRREHQKMGKLLEDDYSRQFITT